MTYESVTVVESQVASEVKFTVAKMSFGRRAELMRRVRELARRIESLEAGQEPEDKVGATLVRAEIDKLYLIWGLRVVTGLSVDGVDATPELLAEAGPENLFREALAAVRTATGLTVSKGEDHARHNAR